MSDVSVFLITEAITLVVAIGVAVLIQRQFRTVLTDLTGTPDRAAFWGTFTSLLLVLIPVIVIMFVARETGSTEAAFFRVVAELRWALVGLVSTLVSYAFVVIWFVQTRSYQRPRE